MWQINHLQYISSGKIHNVLFTEVSGITEFSVSSHMLPDVLFWNYPKRRNRYGTVKGNRVFHLILPANVGRLFMELHQQNNSNILLTAAVWTSGSPSLEKGYKVIHERWEKSCHHPSKCRMHEESVGVGSSCSVGEILCILSHLCLPSNTTA